MVKNTSISIFMGYQFRFLPCLLIASFKKESPLTGASSMGDSLSCLDLRRTHGIGIFMHGVCCLIFLAERGGGNHADNYKTGATKAGNCKAGRM